MTLEEKTVRPLGHVKPLDWSESQMPPMLPSIHVVTPTCVSAPSTVALPCAQKTSSGGSFM